jgi:hypothetical protein
VWVCCALARDAWLPLRRSRVLAANRNVLEALWTNFNQVADGFGLNLAVFKTICGSIDGLRVTADHCEKLFRAFDTDQVQSCADCTLFRVRCGCSARRGRAWRHGRRVCDLLPPCRPAASPRCARVAACSPPILSTVPVYLSPLRGAARAAALPWWCAAWLTTPLYPLLLALPDRTASWMHSSS